jgi:UDP-glucose 4-epimerase
VSGADFRVVRAARRAGDPAQIVADAARARAVLGWRPRLDDLATIVEHAIGWERKLMARTGTASGAHGLDRQRA